MPDRARRRSRPRRGSQPRPRSFGPRGTGRSPAGGHDRDLVLGRVEADARRARCRSPPPRRGACARACRGRAPRRPRRARRRSPTSVWPGRRAPASAASTSVGRLELEREAVAAGLRDLVVRGRGRAEVGHGRGHQQHVGGGELRARRGLELARRSRPSTHAHAGRRWSATLAATSVTSAPRRGCLGGQREAHAPRRAVADVAHRVDRLARAAGGHEHAQAVERSRREPAPCRAAPRRGRGSRRGSARRPDSPLARARRAARVRVARSPRRARAAARGSPGWPGARTCGCSSPAPAPAVPCRPARRS